MKVIRWIQNVAAIAAFALAINLADGQDISFKDACVAGVLVVLSVAMLLGRAMREEQERRAEE